MPRRKKLHLARGLTLPVDAVTETFGFMARRKAGKTYCAQKLAEEMLSVRAQIIVLDPIGNWWSLRLDADGKSPGFDVYVFGGQRGDIPLSSDAGELVADTVIDTEISVVLDVSGMKKKQQRRFVADFCERLFYRRAQDPAATHVFFEECQSFAPQRFGAGDARMVGAVEDIVRKGRNFGLGATMISQRPQSVNKEIFNQVECLFMMQMNGPHERKTMRDWVDYKGVTEAREVVEQLPTLHVGEAWVSSPQLLGILKKVKIEKKTTFDASSAPKVGAKRRRKKLHKLDLDGLEGAMAEVIAKAEADDPKALRKRIAELEGQLQAAQADTAPGADVEELDLLRNDVTVLQAEVDALETTLSKMRTGIALAESSLADLGQMELAPVKVRKRHAPVAPPPRPTPPARASSRTSTSDASGKLSPAEQAILDAIAWWEAVGTREPTRTQLAFVCGVHQRTKSHTNRVSHLRSSGYIDYPEGGRVHLTDEGRALANFPSVPGTTNDLHEMVLARLAPGDREVLQPALDHYPDALTRDDLAEICGVHTRTKSHTNRISKLKSLGVLCYPRSGTVQASDAMFVNGAIQRRGGQR